MHMTQNKVISIYFSDTAIRRKIMASAIHRSLVWIVRRDVGEGGVEEVNKREEIEKQRGVFIRYVSAFFIGILVLCITEFIMLRCPEVMYLFNNMHIVLCLTLIII